MTDVSNKSCSLREGEIQAVLECLHNAAKGDKVKFLGLVPRLLFGLVTRKQFHEIITVNAAKDIYMPISPEQGRFVYQTARAISAKRAVEFGTSFGISTIYLAAAIKDNHGEAVIGTELEPGKYKQAVNNLEEAGLGNFADIRLGDAMETLDDDIGFIDLVLLDGWKDLYLPVLKLLKPKLREGAIVLADNIFTFKKSLKPYVEYMQSGRNGFESVTLPLADGFEYSIYLG